MRNDGGPDKFIFEVFSPSGRWPSVEPRRGYQLSAFFPPGHDSKQLNYGQGEGQVSIDGNEWGFYYSPRNSLRVVLHEGPATLEEAEAIVAAICKKLSGPADGEFTFQRVTDLTQFD